MAQLEKRSALVVRLRTAFNLTEDLATDQEVLDLTEGTFGRALVELDMALVELRTAVMGLWSTDVARLDDGRVRVGSRFFGRRKQ